MDSLYTFFSEPTLPTLFFLSFLAATVLPIGSEWLLIVMILQRVSPPEVVLTASLGNFLGACITYLIGIWGSEFFIRKILRIDDKQLARAGTFYRKYGTWSLLFSWLPVLGDPLCLIAGIFKTSFIRFAMLVFVGKFGRYATLAFLILKGIGVYD